jgi:hypothetical protein
LGQTGRVPPQKIKNLLKHAEQASMKDDKFAGLYRTHPSVKDKMFAGTCKTYSSVKHNNLKGACRIHLSNTDKKICWENRTRQLTKDENYWSM